jgi:hypothetical protein
MFENIFLIFASCCKLLYKYLTKRGFRTVKHGTLKKIGNKTKQNAACHSQLFVKVFENIPPFALLLFFHNVFLF